MRPSGLSEGKSTAASSSGFGDEIGLVLVGKDGNIKKALVHDPKTNSYIDLAEFMPKNINVEKQKKLIESLTSFIKGEPSA